MGGTWAKADASEKCKMRQNLHVLKTSAAVGMDIPTAELKKAGVMLTGACFRNREQTWSPLEATEGGKKKGISPFLSSSTPNSQNLSGNQEKGRSVVCKLSAPVSQS